MPFDDNDLKRLKDFVFEHGITIPDKDTNRDKLTIRRNVMKALLARLEAAEKIADALDYMRDQEGNLPIPEGPELAELNDNVEAWRKAAGR